MSSVPPPVDNDNGEQGWRTHTYTHTNSHAQALRLPRSFTAAAQRKTVLFGSPRGDGKKNKLKKIKNKQGQGRAGLHWLSPKSLQQCHCPFLFYKWRSSLHKRFVLTDDHICFVSVMLSCFFQWWQIKFTFCMNIFFTLDFFFHDTDMGRLRLVIGKLSHLQYSYLSYPDWLY